MGVQDSYLIMGCLYHDLPQSLLITGQHRKTISKKIEDESKVLRVPVYEYAALHKRLNKLKPWWQPDCSLHKIEGAGAHATYLSIFMSLDLVTDKPRQKALAVLSDKSMAQL